MDIPLPPAPPTNPGAASEGGSSEDRQAAWAAAAAALKSVQPPPSQSAPAPPPFAPAAPFPWLQNAFSAAGGQYPPQYNIGAGGNWRPTNVPAPGYAGGQWAGAGAANQWNRGPAPQQQAPPNQQAWRANSFVSGQSHGFPGSDGGGGGGGFKGFAMNKPLQGRLPQLQQKFASAGGGVGFGGPRPWQGGAQGGAAAAVAPSEHMPALGNAPEDVRWVVFCFLVEFVVFEEN